MLAAQEIITVTQYNDVFPVISAPRGRGHQQQQLEQQQQPLQQQQQPQLQRQQQPQVQELQQQRRQQPLLQQQQQLQLQQQRQQQPQLQQQQQPQLQQQQQPQFQQQQQHILQLHSQQQYTPEQHHHPRTPQNLQRLQQELPQQQNQQRRKRKQLPQQQPKQTYQQQPQQRQPEPQPNCTPQHHYPLEVNNQLESLPPLTNLDQLIDEQQQRQQVYVNSVSVVDPDGTSDLGTTRSAFKSAMITLADYEEDFHNDSEDGPYLDDSGITEDITEMDECEENENCEVDPRNELAALKKKMTQMEKENEELKVHLKTYQYAGMFFFFKILLLSSKAHPKPLTPYPYLRKKRNLHK